MIVAVPQESFPGETRVALVPASLPGLQTSGLEVLVESSAGRRAGFSDAQYTEKGARIARDRAELFAADNTLMCFGDGERAMLAGPGVGTEGIAA